MNKLVLVIVVCVVVVDATIFHQQFEISCPGDGSQQGESTKPCNCSALAEKLNSTEVALSQTKQDLTKTNEELENTNEELLKTKNQLSDLKEKPRDCYDVMYYNPNSTSGVYTIFPPNDRPGGIEVSCDMDTDGGGWIVFQNRKDGSVDFYRGWKDYLIGFGDFNGEFWLGLEYIHQLTKYGTYDLRIDMTDFERNEAYAVYSSFSIGEGPGYTLKFGDYFGDAGDSLTDHLNDKFSTIDKDQDSHSDSCAVLYAGAWWFHGCLSCDLNGLYLGGPHEQHYKGVLWKTWKGTDYSLKTANMKIRPNFANYA